MIHVRFEGRSYDVPEHVPGLDGQPTEAEVKALLARHFEVDAGRFDANVVDRRPGGSLVVRPGAVYG